jgi:uncharacterized membrane protein
LKKWFKRVEVFSAKIAKLLADFVGTWTFIFLYSTSMLVWIALHKTGWLHIDDSSFMYWGMWVNYFAGTQASIVLMAQNRDADKDRKKHSRAFRLDEESHVFLRSLMGQVEALEEIVKELIHDRGEKK